MGKQQKNTRHDPQQSLRDITRKRTRGRVGGASPTYGIPRRRQRRGGRGGGTRGARVVERVDRGIQGHEPARSGPEEPFACRAQAKRVACPLSAGHHARGEGRRCRLHVQRSPVHPGITAGFPCKFYSAAAEAAWSAGGTASSSQWDRAERDALRGGLWHLHRARRQEPHGAVTLLPGPLHHAHFCGLRSHPPCAPLQGAQRAAGCRAPSKIHTASRLCPRPPWGHKLALRGPDDRGG